MKNNEDYIVIVAAKRTPMGSFQGVFSTLTATDLGACAIQAILEETQIESHLIDEVYMGCVLPAGLGQAPARQAAIKAGLPLSTACTTVNKVCGSGMKTVMIAHDMIRAGSADIIIAGGMESMSNTPYLVPKVREGLRMGHHQMLDHMFLDGLENAEDNALMGTFAEQCADKYSFTRQQQDEFAIESVKRAVNAIETDQFVSEITPVQVSNRKLDTTVVKDEQPFKCHIEKIPKLRPAFRKENGTVTAANSSSISDGAAAILLMKASQAKSLGLQPMAKIIGHTSHARAPEEFTTAPISAMQNLLNKISWEFSGIDLFEINEAFSVVTMAANKTLNLDANKVNVNGGACALGHPIGASGSRIIVTLIHALQKRKLSKGMATLCIGGGEATAIAIEIMDQEL